MIRNFTKNLLFTAAVITLLSFTARSQERDTTGSTKDVLGKNIIKVNLLSLPLSNFHVEFERAISKKISVGLGVRFMPKGDIPLKWTIIDLIDDPDAEKQIDQFQTGNFAITPEIRFYLSKAALKGFYVAPFARYSHYTASLPFEFDAPNSTNTGTQKETIPLSGNLNTITGGLLLGWQIKISKMVALDLWLLGPQYGSSKGNISGKKALSAQEQQGLRDELKDLDLPLVTTTYTVDANGASVDFKGPWAGVRSGLCLGIRF